MSVATVRTRIINFYAKITKWRLSEKLKNTSFVDFFRPLPFCYFCIKINNSSSGSSHTHTEPTFFLILCFRSFFSEKTSTQQPCLFLEELRRC